MPSPVRFSVVKKLLESKGYKLVRISSSHHIFEKAGVRPQIVPVHRNQVKYGYFRNAQKAP
jgi:predicted RNA binding protein YcfA (HicA-like mRNA interferase family)